MNGWFSVLAQSQASGSRSTALAPIHWVLVIVLAAYLSASMLGTAVGVINLLGVVFVVAFSIVCFAFIFLLFKDRDALRSERFTIDKLRIEKGVLGDTVSGFREVRRGEVVEPVVLSNGSYKTNSS